MRLPTTKTVVVATVAFLLGILAVGVGSIAFHYTSTSEFCISCHEMRIVGEQGWMHSTHYDNPSGVVAECSGCHIPPGLWASMWVRARDGAKDVFVHFFGESDPMKMDWARLRQHAREKISDSSCLRCHANLEPTGMDLNGKVAHREYIRMRGESRCLDCHTDEVHGRFLIHLFGERSSTGRAEQ